MQLIDDRRLTDAGIVGHQYELRRTTLNDAVEAGEQGLDLVLSPVQLFGDEQPIGRVVVAQWELVDPALSFPF